jgi:hypothetical protein
MCDNMRLMEATKNFIFKHNAYVRRKIFISFIFTIWMTLAKTLRQ